MASYYIPIIFTLFSACFFLLIMLGVATYQRRRAFEFQTAKQLSSLIRDVSYLKHRTNTLELGGPEVLTLADFNHRAVAVYSVPPPQD